MNNALIKLFPFLLLFFTGSLLRFWIGLSFPTEDLEFYISDGVSQLSRVGVEKSLLFYPLSFFELRETRIFILSVVMGLLSSFSILMLSESERLPISTAVLVIFTVYLAQIDMHLVRQQISIYLYIIAVCLSGKVVKFMALTLSFIYHEVALVIFVTHSAFYLLRNRFMFFQYQPLMVASLSLSVVSFIMTGGLGTLFSIILILLFYVFKKRSRHIDFFSPSLVFVSLSHILYLLDFIYLVNLERLVGAHVSMMFILLVCHGTFQNSQKLFKGCMICMFFSSYVVFWAVSVT